MSSRDFLMALVATVAVVLSSADAQQVLGTVPSVTVSGSGEQSARPDTAELSVGVVSEATTATEAVRSSNSKVGKVLAALKEQGLTEADLQTTNFEVSPQYRRAVGEAEASRISGYQVSNVVRARVREVKALGAVLDAALSAGANRVYGIRFVILNQTALLNAARKEAFAEARRKAEEYARLAGVSLGRVLLIDEQPQPVYARPLALRAAAPGEGGVPIQEGEERVQVNVSVRFELGTGPRT